MTIKKTLEDKKNTGDFVLQELYEHLHDRKPLPSDTRETFVIMLARLMLASNKKEVGDIVVNGLDLKFSRGAKKKKDHEEVVLYVELMRLSGMSKEDSYKVLQTHVPGHIEPDSIRKRYEKFRSDDIKYWANSLHKKNGPFVINGVPQFDDYEGLKTVGLFCALLRSKRPK